MKKGGAFGTGALNYWSRGAHNRVEVISFQKHILKCVQYFRDLELIERRLLHQIINGVLNLVI